jgi:hypothetical protein
MSSDTKTTAAPTYLGDSVYAEVDPIGQVVLTTRNGIDGISNVIYLDGDVQRALMAYLTKRGAAPEYPLCDTCGGGGTSPGLEGCPDCR